jgi:hypothetical protein
MKEYMCNFLITRRLKLPTNLASLRHTTAISVLIACTLLGQGCKSASVEQKPNPTPQTQATVTKPESHVLQALEETLKNRLTDPDSAEFRHLTLYRDPDSTRGYTLCGEFNSKNRMGGFTGYRRFVSGGLFEQPENPRIEPTIAGAAIEDNGPPHSDKAFELESKECTGIVVATMP